MIKIKDIFRKNTIKVVLLSLLAYGAGCPAWGALRLDVPEFTSLEIMADVSVNIVEGEYPGYIEIEDSQYGTDAIIVSYSDEKLSIMPGKGGEPEIRITSDVLEEISLFRKSSLILDGTLEGKTLKLVGSGEATLNVNKVSTPNLSISMMGKANLNLQSGVVDSMEVSALNASDVTIKNVMADKVKLVVSENASVNVAGVCRKKSIYHIDGGTINAKGLIEDINKMATLFNSDFILNGDLDSVSFPYDKYLFPADSLNFLEADPEWPDRLRKLKELSKSIREKKKKTIPVTQP